MDAHLTTSFSSFCDEMDQSLLDMLLSCVLSYTQTIFRLRKNNFTQDNGAFHLLTCCSD